MKIEIKGLLESTLIDYPGKVAAVVFFSRCGFRCPYCHNPELVLGYKETPAIPPQKVYDLLEKKKKWLDGVSITGGEPTLHKGLAEFIAVIKGRSLAVKLDTNGENPAVLEDLFKKKLLDYVAMDVKGPLDKYDAIAGVKVKKENIKRSVDLIRESGVDYEFRTTVVPKLLAKEDLIKTGEWLKGSRRFNLQQFNPDNLTLDVSYMKEKPYRPDELENFAELLKPYFESVGIRGI